MQLIDEKKAASILAMSVQTLRNHRSMGIGLPYSKIGPKSIRYDQEDVEAYVRSHKVETEAADLAGVQG